MEKKNKIIMALAVGAVAILISSGAVRCSMQSTPAEQPQAPDQEQAANQPADTSENATTNSLAEYENTSWSSADGAWTLNILPGAFIEKGAAQETICYYVVDQIDKTDGGISAELSIAEERGGATKHASLAIVKGSAGPTLTCDALSASYSMPSTEGATIALIGFEEGPAAFGGKGEAEFAQAIQQAASAKSPYAKKAIWTKEAWVNYANHMTITNFTLDDAASTTVSVTIKQSGELVAS